MTSSRPEGYFGRFWQPGNDNSSMDLMVRGWLDGCPNPKKIAQIFTDEWAIYRYFECSLVSAFILDRAQKINPKLAAWLSSSMPRLPGEEPRNFDPFAVPENYRTVLSPGSTIWGYAASRVLIELFGRDPAWKIGDLRVKLGLMILDQALRQTSNPLDFVVILAEKVATVGVDPTAILGHLLAVEHLDEGLYTGIKSTWKRMGKNAPTLRKHYLSLNEPQKIDAGIIPEYLL